MNKKARSRSAKPPRDVSKAAHERADNEGMSMKPSPDWATLKVGKAHSKPPPGQGLNEETSGPKPGPSKPPVACH